MYRLLELNPQLQDFSWDIDYRMQLYRDTKQRLLPDGSTLNNFANAHEYFGIHHVDGGWIYREWAPGADEMYFAGDFNGWDRRGCPMQKKENGVFEVFLQGKDALKNFQRVTAVVIHNGEEFDRIPSYANYVVQDPGTSAWSAAVYAPECGFAWTDDGFKPEQPITRQEMALFTYNAIQKIGKTAFARIRIRNLKTQMNIRDKICKPTG